MKYLIPALALTILSFAACQSENQNNDPSNNNDSGAYVNPQTGSEGMTIPDRDTPYIETNSPELLKKADSSMKNNTDAAGNTPAQAY